MARPKSNIAEGAETDLRQIKHGQTITFRSPDEGFTNAFNTALRISGWSANELTVRALRNGLPQTMTQVLQERADKMRWEQQMNEIDKQAADQEQLMRSTSGPKPQAPSRSEGNDRTD
jgi:hypothetical protein